MFQQQITGQLRMPTLFVGHGSPMNALTVSDYSKRLGIIRRAIPQPQAILVISAHWRTPGIHILSAANPKTIHDFGGFPQALHEVQYPAPGNPDLAIQIRELLRDEGAELSEDWGLDHGAWSVLLHMYPEAEIPVLQLGLAKKLGTHEHYALAQKLKPLRDHGILILGSGNITHNLGELDWEGLSPPMEWATQFDEYIKMGILKRNLDTLLDFASVDSRLRRRALPTLEHYLPLLYALGASDADESVQFPIDEIQMGSLSMRSVVFGADAINLSVSLA